MTGRVAHIFRHPIKSHGREELGEVALTAGATMPWDRTWAVAHEESKADGTTWAECANFSIGSKAPGLMAINARLDEASEVVTLTHPDRPAISLHPERDAAQLIDWARPLMPADRARSVRVVRVAGRGMTDSDFPSVTVANLASHREVENRMGRELSVLRWRSNFWLDGLEPWEEFDLIGREFRLGDAVLRGVERTVRCKATTANPATGRRDADTLKALEEGWSHRDFSIRAEVVRGGKVAVGQIGGHAP